MIQINFQRVSAWRIYTPPVIRYLPKRFVDDFFESGALRLSSFERFAKHEDEVRVDESEGKFVYSASGDNMTLMFSGAVGTDSYTLCASEDISNDAMRRYKDCEDGIVIDDTTKFALAISEQLPGFKHGLEGPCTYNGRLLRRSHPQMTMDQVLAKNEDGSIDVNSLHGLLELAGPDAVFAKDPKHVADREYRFLFMVSSLDAPYIDIKVPNARTLCRRFSELNSPER